MASADRLRDASASLGKTEPSRLTSAQFSIRYGPTGRTLALRGDWSSLTLGEDALKLGAVVANIKGPVHLDLLGIGKLDTAGAYTILQAVLPTLESAQLPQRAERLFNLVRPLVHPERPPAAHDPFLIRFLARTGRVLMAIGREVSRGAEFIGRLTVELGHSLRRPAKLRAAPLARAMETAGIDALPIIVAMNFFIGAVVAVVGADLLARLGVAIYTVQLIGVAVLREFAVLITAILLAGRSSSSFAAQIGSMKMNQEVDALQVIGVDPFHALVIPRVLALLLIMPLLSFAAMVAGLSGGLLVSWVALDISPVFFVERMRETVDIRHFWAGMSKTPLLAILIAMAGCRHGLSVAGDVESLGNRVTAAVVQSIFMIILFDAIFAVIYMELNL
ncbi:MAG TPA: ABC transporter permease [Sphingobium sp.]|nr:ABC transporter permease [Sphingobium sp.]